MVRTKRGINIHQFAERHGWVVRTVYRDVETLCAAGVPVEQPEHGRFSVPESCLPPVTIDVRPDELMALSAARQLAPGLKDTTIGRGLASLWSKLSAPGHQTQLPLGDETWFHAGAMAPIDYGPHQIVLDAVRESLRTRRALRIRYCKPGAEPSERTIEPAFVCWDAGAEAAYVRAWCRKREELRTFAIHRVAHAELTDQLFAVRREAIAEMSNAFRLWARKTTERVVLWFSPRVAGEVRERRWHPTARMTDTDDGGLVLEMDVGAPDELERVLLGYGADVVIEAPEALAERIRQRHAEAAGPERLGMLRAVRPERPADAAASRRRRSKP